jgi:hypothetical protein
MSSRRPLSNAIRSIRLIPPIDRGRMVHGPSGRKGRDTRMEGSCTLRPPVFLPTARGYYRGAGSGSRRTALPSTAVKVFGLGKSLSHKLFPSPKTFTAVLGRAVLLTNFLAEGIEPPGKRGIPRSPGALVEIGSWKRRATNPGARYSWETYRWEGGGLELVCKRGMR